MSPYISIFLYSVVVSTALRMQHGYHTTPGQTHMKSDIKLFVHHKRQEEKQGGGSVSLRL